MTTPRWVSIRVKNWGSTAARSQESERWIEIPRREMVFQILFTICLIILFKASFLGRRAWVSGSWNNCHIGLFDYPFPLTFPPTSPWRILMWRQVTGNMNLGHRNYPRNSPSTAKGVLDLTTKITNVYIDLRLYISNGRLFCHFIPKIVFFISVFVRFWSSTWYLEDQTSKTLFAGHKTRNTYDGDKLTISISMYVSQQTLSHVQS